MVTNNVFIYMAVSVHFIAIQGLRELPQNISAPTEVVRSIIDQILAENDSRLEEFTPIFHYFINLTILENQSREKVSELITADCISNDENQKLYGSFTWQDAINEALNEENINITTDFNETLHEDVVEFIRDSASNPEGLKDRYIQNLQDYGIYEDIDGPADEASEVEEADDGSQRNDEVWNFTDTRRIYRGEKTKIKLFPFMASVHLFDRFACAGAIVSSDLVITAASCLQLAWNNRFFRENPAFISVRVGSHFFVVGGEVIAVQEVYFHPSYVPRTLQHNLALMRLRKHIHFKRKKRNVKKINIDRTASPLPVNTPGITIVGWGAKTISNTITNAMSNKIHMAVLDPFDLESCREIYGKKFVTKKNFCAGFITKGQGACNHDVGDPGVSYGMLVGVTSFGSPVCGRADTPTVFTKVGFYADWIDDIMELDVPHIKMRTTTRSLKIKRPIKLYGEDPDEHKPISLREAKALQGVGTGIMANKFIREEVGIQPIIDASLPRDEEGRILLREPYNTEEEKVPVKYSEEGIEIDGSDNDKSEIRTMSPVMYTTSLIGYDPVESISKETEERETGNMDDIRTIKLSKIDYDKSDLSDTNAATGKTVTNIIDPEESMSSESPLNAGENIVNMVPQLDSDYERHDTTGMNIEDDPTTNEREPTTNEGDLMVLKENQRLSSAVVDETNSQEEVDIEDEGKNYSHNPNTDEVAYTIGFGSVGIKQDDIIEKHHDASQTDDDVQVNEQARDGVPAELSEDVLKREIEKLIKELDVSSDQNEVTEDSKLSNNNNSEEKKVTVNSKPQGSLKNKTRDHSDQKLTLLYLGENEKKVIKRAESDVSDDEGLSIDPKPFEANVKNKPFKENVRSKPFDKNANNKPFEEHFKSNKGFMDDLIGEKEIYEIFADVMNTMANKTFI